MKKLLYVLVVCAAFQAQAQKTLSKDYAFKVSQPYRVVDAESKHYFAKGNEALAVKFDEKIVTIQKFDTEKPAFVKVREYEKFFPKNYVLEDVMEVSDKLYVFYSSWDGDADKEQLFAQEIDFASGEFAGSAKLLVQVDGKVAGTMVKDGMMSMKIVDKFDMMRSFDKKNVLAQYRRKPEYKNDKKSFDIIGMCAFNGNLEKLSVREVKMPYTERRMNNLDYQLDNKGNLYMLAKVFHDDSNDDKKKKKDTVANYHVEMLSIKSGSDKVEISKFDNQNKFINRIWMYDTNKDYLVGGGFYNNGKKAEYDDSDGVFVFKVTADGKITDQKFHEIPLDVLNAFESKKNIKKNAKKEEKGESAKMRDMTLRDIEVFADGSMILIGEQYDVKSHTMNSMNGGSRTTYTYHYGDILATKLDAAGDLSWMRKIPKNQVGTKGQGGMSYKYFFANNNHYIAFLDNVKNIELQSEKEPEKHTDGQGGYLTCVKIEQDGAMKKGSILNAREVSDFKIYQFSVDRIMKTGENSFMLEAYKKSKEDIMIKVTLN